MSDCSHERTKVELLQRGQEHYAHVVCSDCNTALCFRPHPHRVSIRQRNAINVQKLSRLNSLTQWEKGFLEGVAQNPRPNPRQQTLLDELADKYLRRGIKQNEPSREAAPVTAG